MFGLASFAHSLWTSQLRFPSFTFLTHLLALVLSVIIGCTVAVRAITLLFTHGYIPSPMWQSLLPHEGAMPSLEDDIGVALLKVGVACIESTQFSGLRNELAPVEEPQPQVRLNVDGCEMVGLKYGKGGGFNTRVDKIEAAELRDPNAENPYVTQMARFWAAVAELIHNLFWTTVLSSWVGRDIYRLTWRMYQGRWWYGPRQWAFWRREAWDGPPPRFFPSEPPLLIAWAINKTRRQAMARLRAGIVAMPAQQAASDPTIEPQDEPGWTYDQVLRGEVELEDDEDDWRSEGSNESAESASDGEEDGEVMLYRDLVRARSPATGEGEASIQPILLAHLTYSSNSPLTRRRYAAMLSGPSGSMSALGASAPSTPTRGITTATSLGPTQSPLDAAIFARQGETTGAPRDEWDEERRHSCVICMVATRDVILWPCRCLLMCSDCRESLAARLSAKDHACPNCRTKVEGYSRIYVP